MLCFHDSDIFSYRVINVWPGLLAQQFLGLRVVNQDLIQVFLVKDEEIGKAMGNYICCAPVTPTNCEQTANQKKLWLKIIFYTPTDISYPESRLVS